MATMVRMGIGDDTELSASIDAAANTYSDCGADQIALYVGTGFTARRKSSQVQVAIERCLDMATGKAQTAPGTAASGTASLLNVVAGEVLTVNGTAFTAVAASPTGNQFLVGADDNATADNLVAAIAASLVGRDISCSVADSANPGVDPAVITLTARRKGTAGNAYTLAETGTTITVSGAVLAGGVDALEVFYMTADTAIPLRTTKAGGDAVVETHVAVVVGQNVHYKLERTGLIRAAVRNAVERYQRAYGVFA